jgi:hypothetical protein
MSSRLSNDSFPRNSNGELVDSCKSSKLLTTSTHVVEGPGVLVSLLCYTNGVNDITVTIHDGSSNADDVNLKMVVKGEDKIGGIMRAKVRFSKGIFVELSGTGAEAIALYLD